MFSSCPRLSFALAMLLLGASFIPIMAIAGANDSFTPQSGNIFITSDSRGEFICARANESLPWSLGYQDKKGNFKTVKGVIAQKKKDLKKATDSKKKTKILKDIEKRRKFLKLGSPVCTQGPGESGVLPTPVPPIAPTATPTPSGPSNTCFSGDWSKPGCFGLPAGTSGNKRTGATYFETFCDGCHSSKSNINYQGLLNAFTKPEMQGFQPSDPQDIYNLVAWLNRFTL